MVSKRHAYWRKRSCQSDMGAFVIASLSIVLVGCSELGPQKVERLANQARYSFTDETGAPMQMEQIVFLQGEWETRASFINPRNFEDSWTLTAPQSASCHAILSGAFIQCEMDTLFPQGFSWRTVSIFSFDRYQDTHRVAFMDDQWALFDVYEGRIQDGILKADNRNTKTFGPGGLNGEFIPAGFELATGDTLDEFSFSWMSDFGGATYWRPVIKIDFIRKVDTSGDT